MSHTGPNISDVVAGRVFGSLRGGKCWIYTYKTVLLYVLPTPACNSWKHLKKTCDLSLLAWLPPVSMAVYYCLVEHSSGNTAERNFLNCVVMKLTEGFLFMRGLMIWTCRCGFRREYPPRVTPKMFLLEWSRKEKLEQPLYETVRNSSVTQIGDQNANSWAPTVLSWETMETVNTPSTCTVYWNKALYQACK